jgi:hypothetical protein
MFQTQMKDHLQILPRTSSTCLSSPRKVNDDKVWSIIVLRLQRFRERLMNIDLLLNKKAIEEF